MKPVELLAPAKDYRSVVAAVDYGADAVYIGGAKFGARQAAGNDAGEIARAAEYAHRFGVRVHATLNTLLWDDELEEAERQARELIAAGIDALIVQDMALRRMALPVELHASTQVCNRTPEGARFLGEAGFARVILERALPLDEIRAICAATAAEVECFVHGAICVGYSGRCFLSRSMSGRSGNRGACSQPCRLPWDLTDGAGRTCLAGKHLLSVRDLNLAAHVGELLDAGVTSFKIEGRLKDVNYIRNVVAYYRRVVDEALAARPGLVRASVGESVPDFTPDPSKSFTRGETDYFFAGKRAGVASFDTPKAVGERIGRVKRVERDAFRLEYAASGNAGPGRSAARDSAAGMRGCSAMSDSAMSDSAVPGSAAGGYGRASSAGLEAFSGGTSHSAGAVSGKPGRSDAFLPPVSGEPGRSDAFMPPVSGGSARSGGASTLAPGDGICFLTPQGLIGTNVNAVEGDRITPNRMEGIVAGAVVYRNFDRRFNRLVEASRTRRVIPVSAEVEASVGGVLFRYTDCEGFTSEVRSAAALDPAKNPEANTQSLRVQAARSGDTDFAVRAVSVRGGEWFVPASLAAELRREGLRNLAEERRKRRIEHRILPDNPAAKYPSERLSAEENVTNRLAEAFYRGHGVREIERGLDLAPSTAGHTVMRSSYCIRREIGECLLERPRLTGALYLVRGAQRYRLDFDCARCEMSLVDCTENKKK